MTQIEKQQNRNSVANIIIKLFLPIFGVWVGYLLVFAFAPKDWEMKGQIGDSFGGLNTLFSGLAFGGIIYSLRQQSVALDLQRKELTLQREELRLTREELAKSADAQQKSEVALNKQLAIMNNTAKLNAHKSLLDYYMNQNQNSRGMDIANRSNSSQDITYCVNSMQKILKELEREAN